MATHNMPIRRILLSHRPRAWAPFLRKYSTSPPAFTATAPPPPPPRSSASLRQRLLLLPLLTLTVLTSAGTGVILAMGAYGAYRINKSRTRWFSDSFVLSPESLRMPYKKIEFTTKGQDPVTLEGWYIEQTNKGKPSDRVVLCCNPFNHDKSTLLAVARGLWDTGHSVLLFDFRSFGPEKVPHETIGYLELNDARAALEWLRANKPPMAKIGIMGCSMGGAMSLCLAIENDEEIVGVATDCAFACLKDVVHNYIIRTLPENLPQRARVADLILHSLAMFNHLFYGYDLAKVGPAGLGLEGLRVPLLILHSELDSIVPVDQGRRIYTESSTAEEEKKFVLMKQCEHIGSFFRNEIAYTKRIVQFLDRCFDRAEVHP